MTDRRRIIGWACPHMNLTSIPQVQGMPPILRVIAPRCGCEMTPIREVQR